jgi:pimeloyl-ACP methyl ester carboxylesterase
MQIIDRGSGPPLVLIPGLQGRWEYLRPAVDALSAFFRVLTFSLDDIIHAKTGAVEGRGLDPYADAVAALIAAARVERATICGVSFGGLIAVRFAARYPAHCDALILASTPRPRLRLRPRHEMYLRAPWIFGPIFLAETPFRLNPEICAAIPDAKARRRFSLRSLRTAIGAPVSLSRMAARARMISTEDVTPDCARITAPTLVVTGEGHLDHVVPVEGSSEYLQLIPNSRAAVIERTGHLGSITRPDAFAAILAAFVCDAGTDARVPSHGDGEAGQRARRDGGRPPLDAARDALSSSTGGPAHGSAPTGRVA